MNPYDFEEEALASAVAAAAGAPAPEPWAETRVVGARLPRVDAYDRVSGTAVYASDVSLPGMLHAAVVRCPHAHARVTRVDVTKAERLPGVRAVLTAPSAGGGVGWYAGPKGPLSTLFDPHCRFAGEEVAAVAADTPYQAQDAARAIEVQYEVLPFAVDLDTAQAPGATPVLGDSNLAGEPRVVERGDLAAGFAAADVVVEGEYSTATELHVPIEPHGCVARWDGTRLTVWDSLQGVFPAQATLARALRLPLARVRVIGPYMGGGFGAKLDTGKYGVIAALLAQKTGRPVRLFMTREETMLAIGNRPGVRMRVKVGARKDGTLTALDFSCIGSGGAYSAGGTGGVDWQALDLYRCPNVRARSTNVYVNLGPERPFRAPGHPQGAWGLEQALDDLAITLKMDPVALRLRNLTEVSQARPNQPRYTSTGLRECLVEGAKAFGWSEARAKGPGAGPVRRGVGMAGGMWRAGGGGPPCTIIVRLFADGSANVNMGASDLGTGTKTWAAMIVAEELGALRHHPVLTVDGPEALTSDGTPMREPACWIGDYLLYLADDNGPFCVNLNVKATAAGFKRSDDTNGSHEDSVIPDPKVELRHTAEAIYYQDAGITTHQVAANTIDDIVVENLKVVMHWATPASRLPEDCRASIVEAFLYGMDGGSPPLEVMRALKLDQGLDEQDIKSAFYRGIYQRKIRVDLFMPVLFDAPLALEKVDVLELYKHWFRRSGS